jgi:hypothetical protein
LAPGTPILSATGHSSLLVRHGLDLSQRHANGAEIDTRLKTSNFRSWSERQAVDHVPLLDWRPHRLGQVVVSLPKYAYIP